MNPSILYANREVFDPADAEPAQPIDEARAAAVRRGCRDTGRVVIGMHYRPPPPPQSADAELFQRLLIDPPPRTLAGKLRRMFG